MSEAVIRLAWQRARGKCECTCFDHDHPYIRCNKTLDWDRQDKPGGWKPQYHIGYGSDVIAAYKILCWECYQKADKDSGRPGRRL